MAHSTVAGAASAACLACSVGAQTFHGLGALPGHLASSASAVSADGTTVVGVSGGLTTLGSPQPFRWTQAAGMQPLDLLAGAIHGQAHAVSGDGSVIVGSNWIQNSSAVRWTPEVEGLGMLPGTPFSAATGVSADGLRVVGRSGSFKAFSWTPIAGLTELPPLPMSTTAQAYGLSADGSVAVGESHNGSIFTAVRWTAAGVEEIGNVPGAAITQASAASADGSVVVGWGIRQGVSNNRAFRWTHAGGLTWFDVLPGGTFTHATAVSADGFVVVGRANTTGLLDASFVWTPALGLRNLRQFLEQQGANLTGWAELGHAQGISADGRTIVGVGTGPGGHEQAWIATIPGWAACAANCDGSSQPPVLNVADFTCFLQLFASGSDHANCDFSTAPPTLNVADFTCFLQKFAAGCP